MVSYHAGAASAAAGMSAGELLDLMVRHGSLDFTFQFARAWPPPPTSRSTRRSPTCPVTHRDFVEALIPYMPERSA